MTQSLCHQSHSFKHSNNIQILFFTFVKTKPIKMKAFVAVLALVAVAQAGVIAPLATIARVPSLDSAVIQSDRVGGNFAYSVSEAHAHAISQPIIQHVAQPVAVSYSAPAISIAPQVAVAKTVVAAPQVVAAPVARAVVAAPQVVAAQHVVAAPVARTVVAAPQLLANTVVAQPQVAVARTVLAHNTVLAPGLSTIGAPAATVLLK